MFEQSRMNGRSTPTKNTRLARRLDSAGWGLFFIWVGIALLMDLGWGVGLVGVAAITLGAQAARRCYGLRVEGFWVICGLALLVGGLWRMFEVEFSPIPILLIAAGAAVLLSPSMAKRRGVCRCWPRLQRPE